jgi:hypothetical protein
MREKHNISLSESDLHVSEINDQFLEDNTATVGGKVVNSFKLSYGQLEVKPIIFKIYLYYIFVNDQKECDIYSNLCDEEFKCWYAFTDESNNIRVKSITREHEPGKVRIIPLYVGKTYSPLDTRDRDHMCKKRNKANKHLQNIKKETELKLCILEEKSYEPITDGTTKEIQGKGNVWCHKKEIEYIKKYNTFKKGLNGTRGGSLGKKGSLLDYSFKKSRKFGMKFLYFAEIHHKNTGENLGAVQRDLIVQGIYLGKLIDYKLGKELHKFRGNPYTTLWADPEFVKRLNNVGYTNTSKEAGVIRSARCGKNRVQNKLPHYKRVIQCIFDHHGHINISQQEEFPPNVPEELKEQISYSCAGAIITEIRQRRIIPEDDEFISYMEKKLKFCWTHNEWNEVMLFEATQLFYEHYQGFSHPPQGFTFDENFISKYDDIPKYLYNYKLGNNFYQRIVKKITEFKNVQIRKKLHELFESNKFKPKVPPYFFKPGKKEIMVEKVRAAAKAKSSEFYEKRGWGSILKKKFTFGYNSHYTPPVYGVSRKRLPKSGHQGLRWDPKRNAWFISWKTHNCWRHKLFTVPKNNTSESIIEEKKKEALTCLQKMLVIFPRKEKNPPIKRGAQYRFVQSLISGKGIYNLSKTVSGFPSRHECYLFVRKQALGAFYFRRWYIFTKLRIHRRKDQ